MASDYTGVLKERLKANGCYFYRQAHGNHEIWYSPHTNRKFCVPASTKSRHTANQILRKQAGINERI